MKTSLIRSKSLFGMWLRNLEAGKRVYSFYRIFISFFDKCGKFCIKYLDIILHYVIFMHKLYIINNTFVEYLTEF